VELYNILLNYSDVMLDGGNAVDAAIATLLCAGVVNPQSSGLSGGLMMAVYDSKTGKTSCLDARERTLVAASREHENMTSFKESNVTVVPGQLSGYWIAHQRYGRLPWYRLVLPSAFLADDELIVSKNLAKMLKDKSEFIEAEPSMRFKSLKKTVFILICFALISIYYLQGISKRKWSSVSSRRRSQDANISKNA